MATERTVCSFPLCATDLSCEWLSMALNYTITKIAYERLGESTGFLSQIYRITYHCHDVERSVVIKFPNDAGKQSPGNFYEKEVKFYQQIVVHGPQGIESPHCYYVDSDQEYKNFILILEDCRDPYSVGNLTNGLCVNETLEALHQLAHFHAKWWKNKDDLPFINNTNIALSYAPLVKTVWEKTGKECFRHENLLKDDVERVIEFISMYAKQIKQKNKTLVHGDFRPDNLMVWRGDSSTERSVIVLDFQALHRGNPMEDVAYLISCGVDIANRQKYQAKYLRKYYNSLLSFGVTDYSYEQCIMDYREQLIYCMLVPVLKSASSCNHEQSDSTEKMRRLWRERCVSALLDNHCAQLLPAMISDIEASSH